MHSEMADRQIIEGTIWKQLLLFFFPILLGTFFQQMYNTVDTIIVGRGVGTVALAAVGSTGALVNMLNGFFIGVGSGAAVILSQKYGAADTEGVQRTLHTAVTLAIVLGLLISIIGVGFGPVILRLMKTPDSCFREASLYVRIIFCGAAGSMLYNMGAGILRAMGDSRRPTMFLTITCGMNIAMDLLFVLVFRMGVAGAAIATVLSQFFSGWLLLRALRGLEYCPLQFSQLGIDRDLLVRILKIGVPAGLQFVTFDFSNILIQSCINSFGDIVMAGWTAYTRTDTLTWMVSGAFGVSITTFVGQNFGAAKYRRIRQSVWTCLAMSTALIGMTSVLLLTFRILILGIYSSDPEVIRAGAYIMTIIAPFNVAFMPVEVFGGAMRGTGYSTVPTVITGTCICLFRVLWISTVVAANHSLNLLAICYPISWVLSAVVFSVIYFRGNWLRKRIALCGMEPEIS